MQGQWLDISSFMIVLEQRFSTYHS